MSINCKLNVCYTLVTSSWLENGQQAECYGILCLNNGKREFVFNLSDNFEKVAQLVELLNSKEVEPCHLIEVSQDFLN